jgi:hypothetical protein
LTLDPPLSPPEVPGFSLATLHPHRRSEINTSTADAVARVTDSLYNRAIGGDVNAMKFFLENRAGNSGPNA